jgi:hypothetical protein
MSFSTTTTSITYNGDGSEYTFEIPFDYLDDSEIKVKFFDYTDADPANWTTDLMTLNSDYEIVAGYVSMPLTPPTVDQKVMIYRETIDYNQTVYSTYQFPYTTVNTQMDRIFQRLQELETMVAKCIAFSDLSIANGEPIITGESVVTTQELTDANVAALEAFEDDIATVNGYVAVVQNHAADALASAAAAAASEAAAAASATAAQTAETNAETAETNAETAQAAAEAAALVAEGHADDAAASAMSLAPAWVAVQNVSAGGEINNNTAYFQNRKVQGAGAVARITSNTPFGSFATDGATITLCGQSDTATVQIPYADVDYGCLLNGTATLGNNDIITLRFDLTALRWREVSRNF